LFKNNKISSKSFEVFDKEKINNETFLGEKREKKFFEDSDKNDVI
jgi:hypothetical protein